MTESSGNATTALTITAQHEAPQAFAREVPNAIPQSQELANVSKGDTQESQDRAELARLKTRVLAEPTSFRAQQELASFEALKGIK